MTKVPPFSVLQEHPVKRYAVAVLLSVTVPGVVAAQVAPPPTPQLLGALATARMSHMQRLVPWSARPTPPDPADLDAAAETTILALPQPDRDALLFWLASHGRGALHARGARDDDIGVPYFPVDYAIVAAPFPASIVPLPMADVMPMPPAPTAAPRRRTHFGLLGALLPALTLPIASSSSSSTSSSTTQNGNSTDYTQTSRSSGASVSIGGNPWAAIGSLIDASNARAARRAAVPSGPWRNLPFAASALGSANAPITVNRGFAAVRFDGTEGVACISFTNASEATVTGVDVDIEILDGRGLIKRVAALHRSGTFAPGTEVGGPGTPQSVNEARANCVIDGENTLTDLTDPFSNAGAVAYSVRQVLYADGTAWLQPGANAWPAALPPPVTRPAN